MTLREQLAEQAAVIRARWAQTPPPAMPRVEEFVLDCRPTVPPMAAIREASGRVNASAVGGAGAGYLLVRAIATEPVDTSGGKPTSRVIVRIAYREKPWTGFAADFGALLDALEAKPGAGAADEREETWHDRPGML